MGRVRPGCGSVVRRRGFRSNAHWAALCAVVVDASSPTAARGGSTRRARATHGPQS